MAQFLTPFNIYCLSCDWEEELESEALYYPPELRKGREFCPICGGYTDALKLGPAKLRA